MRIFDIYEHPSFEVEKADKTAAQAILLRLGVGFTVSAIAAIGFWGYQWSDLSPPPFLIVMEMSLTLHLLGYNQLGVPATWPTGLWGTHHSVGRKGGH
jgi:hypothetical protein